MRAGLRFCIAAAVAGMALAPVPSLAQDAASNSATPATDSIGPRELENFNLNGTVTRQSTAPAPAPAPTQRPAPTQTTPSGPADREPARTVERSEPRTSADRSIADRAAAPQRAERATPPAPISVPGSEVLTTAPTEPATDPVAEPLPVTTGSPAEHSSPLPWILALLAAAGAAGFVFWRQRAAPGYATAGGYEEYLREESGASQPLARVPGRAPSPVPRPVAPPAPQPTPDVPPGIVSTTLRPRLEIDFKPTRCIVEEDKATIEFDVEVFNSGAAPARDVLIEGAMFNAGPTQDRQIGAFFAKPLGAGDRVPSIPAMKRIALKSAVYLPADKLLQFEVAGKRLLVPMVAFNVLYRWGSAKEGQTSSSYLVGRDNKTEKLAPLRLDLGPRIFRGLGAREHEAHVRT